MVSRPAPDFSTPARDKWEREYRAFWLMLPHLLQTRRGRYVAVHEGRLVGSGEASLPLAMRVYATYGYVPIYVGLVAEKVRVDRVPHFRVLAE